MDADAAGRLMAAGTALALSAAARSRAMQSPGSKGILSPPREVDGFTLSPEERAAIRAAFDDVSGAMTAPDA